MKITMEILYENLQDFSPVMIKKEEKEKAKYIGFLPMEPGMIKNRGAYVFVGSSKEIMRYKIPEECGIICLGEIVERKASQEWLVLSENTDKSRLFVALQETFYKYQQWDEKLSEILRKNESILEYCKISVSIFGNPIFVHNNNFEIIASVNEMPGQEMWSEDKCSGRKIVKMDTMNDLKVSETYKESLRTKGAHIFPAQVFGYRGLYVNLWDGEVYMGRICINELGRSFRKSDFMFLEYLAEYVQAAFKKGSPFLGNTYRELEASFLELLNRGETDEELLRSRLKYREWKLNAGFVCVFIQPEQRDFSTHMIEYTCRRLETLFSDMCCFPYKRGIFLIQYTGREGFQEQVFFKKISIFLRDGLFKAGISQKGKSFLYMKHYYYQCIYALELGEKEEPDFWIHRFEKHRVSCFIREAGRSLLPEMYCLEEVLELKAYDEKHDTELFKTLEVFLKEDRNLTKTSENLYVHRSTLLYRLERIRKITGLNLEKYEVRFAVLLSYEILKRKVK